MIPLMQWDSPACLDVSIVLCTWNNAAQLDRMLTAMRDSNIPSGLKWELIVVNNNSTDHTKQIAAKHREYLPVVHVFEAEQGESPARNTGLRAAHGKLIISTDDDVRPDPQWIKQYWQAFCDQPENTFFGGLVRCEYDGPAPDPKLLQYAPASVRGTNFGGKARVLRKDESFIAPNWACPRAAFQQVGGYDTDLGLNPNLPYPRTGTETDMMRRLHDHGWQARYLPSASLTHLVASHKTSLKHIGSYRRAGGFYDQYLQLDHGVPRHTPPWMYREAVARLGRFMWDRLRGKPAYQSYINWQIMRGRFDALSWRRKTA